MRMNDQQSLDKLLVAQQLVALDKAIQVYLNKPVSKSYNNSAIGTSLYQVLLCYAALRKPSSDLFTQGSMPPYSRLLLSLDAYHYLHTLAGSVLNALTYSVLSYQTLKVIAEQMMGRLVVEVQQEEFKQQLKAYQRASRDNAKHYRQYLQTLLEQYRRLLIVRVDLGYQQGNPSAHDYTAFCETFDRFKRRFLLSTEIHGRVGYLWKMEYGLTKGFHVHLLLAYDGDVRLGYYFIANQVGKLWRNVVEEGGVFYNCNTVQHTRHYPVRCVGLVEHKDDKVVEALLNRLIPYLVKTDPYVKLMAGSRRKLTDRGQLLSA